MSRWVVDTNVLLVATRAHLGEPPRKLKRRGEDVPVKDAANLEAVFNWLASLNSSSDALVLDMPYDRIRDEYANKLEKDEYGRMVVANKLSRGQCHFSEVEYDHNDHALIPHEQGVHVSDTSDRKMVAAAMDARAPIANACDTDWCDLEHDGVLEKLGVEVHHVIEDWCRAEWQRKKAR